MGAPSNVSEALDRAPVLGADKVALRVASLATSQLIAVIQAAVNDYHSSLALAKQDLRNAPQVALANVGWGDEAVAVISKMFNSEGMRHLALLRNALLRLSESSERINTWRTLQFMAWLQGGDKAKSWQNQILILISKVEQVPVAIGRSLRTPVQFWGKEVGELFETGGGLGDIKEMFAGTPFAALGEVTTSSLMNYLELMQMADEQERLMVDMQIKAGILNRKTGLAASLGQQHLLAFQRAEDRYNRYKSDLEAMRHEPGTEMNQEYMKELAHLTRLNQRTLKEYQNLEAKVKADPRRIDEDRRNLIQCLTTAEAYAQSAQRLRSLAVMFRQSAVFHVNQVILLTLQMSNVFCDKLFAEGNRLQQELRLQNFDLDLQAIANLPKQQFAQEETPITIIEQ